jgi:hypothetical protein
MAHQI